MSCYKTSNNKHFNSTALMSDGRPFTDYRPSYEVNNSMIKNNDIKNVHDYRMFLMNNATKIMDSNDKYIHMKNGYGNCKEPYEYGTMLPEKTRIVCDQFKCNEVLVDENGLGQGRQYSTVGENSLVDSIKEPKYIFDNNVCATLEDNFNYYPVKDRYKNEEMRPLVPSGSNVLQGGDPK
jgi:hypothetical protein